MVRSYDKQLRLRLSKSIVDHALWKRFQENIKAEFQPDLLSIDELTEFAKTNGIEETNLISDVDGARCRLTGGIFHIHKIAATPYIALLHAINDLQKEVYEFECNRSSIQC